MKKKIVIGLFLVLILLTVLVFTVSAVEEYKFDSSNGHDILEGMGVAIIIVIGVISVFYEIDLLITVSYFFSKNKTKLKTILNVLSNLCLILVFFSDPISDFLWKYVSNVVFSEDWIIPIGFIMLYFILRVAYFISLTLGSIKAESES